MFNFLKSRRKKNYEQVALSNLCEFLNIGSYDKSRMAEVTYFTCLKVLSEAVSKLPIALQKVTDDNGIIDMTSDTLWTTIRTRPNPFMTPCTFWSATENCRNHYGNAYVYIDRSTSGVNLWILDPKCVRIKMSMLCDLSEQPDIYYVYTSPQSGEEHVYKSDEILHFKTSTTFGGLIGLSVQEKLKLSLDGAVKSQEMLNSLYENNFVPKVAVQFQPGAETYTQLKEQYIQQLQNYADGKVKGTRSFLPVAFGTSLVPLNIKLTDGQFLELRKYTALQIASAFGIKPNHLNDYEKSSYTNSETQQLAFYTDTMLYFIKQYEEELNFKLLSDEQRKAGYRFKFNIAAVLRGDTKSQLESLAQGVSNGVYTPNEARRNLDLPSKPGGDRLYFNGSNIPIEQAGEQYKDTPDTKSLVTLAKSLESAIIDLHKYSDGQPRDDRGRWIDAGGGGSSSGGGSGKLTQAEETAISTYISSESYVVNEKLRSGIDLTAEEQKTVDNLDSALEKMPKYEGTVYRSLSSDMMNNPQEFWQLHQTGNFVQYKAYTSSSLEVYDETMDIQCVIQSKNGRNITAYNDNEKEVLFMRDATFRIAAVKENIIYMEEW